MSAKLGAWTISCPHIFTLRTSRHQSASRRKKQKLKWKNYFDSQESRQDRPQGLKQDNYWTFKNLGLTAVQCKGIAGCTYSLKSTLCRLQVTLQYFTWLKGKYVVLRLLFFLLEKLAWMTLFRGPGSIGLWGFPLRMGFTVYPIIQRALVHSKSHWQRLGAHQSPPTKVLMPPCMLVTIRTATMDGDRNARYCAMWDNMRIIWAMASTHSKEWTHKSHCI